MGVIVLTGPESPFWKMKGVQEMNGGDDCIAMWTLNATEQYTYKWLNSKFLCICILTAWRSIPALRLGGDSKWTEKGRGPRLRRAAKQLGRAGPQHNGTPYLPTQKLAGNGAFLHESLLISGSAGRGNGKKKVPLNTSINIETNVLGINSISRRGASIRHIITRGIISRNHR